MDTQIRTLKGSGNSLTKMPPKWRLHLMRLLFFVNFIGLVGDSWSSILFPHDQLDALSGVAMSFWAGFSVLNLLGVRFPLKLLPILLLQLLYKAAWILGTYLPARNHGLLNEEYQSFFWICIAGIVLNLLIIPWPYFYRNFLQGFFSFKLRTS